MRGWAWGLLLLALAGWVLGVHSTAPAPTAGAPARAIDGSARAPRAAAAATTFEVLHGRNLAAALSRFSTSAAPEEVRRLRLEVDAACRALVLLELDGRTEADTRREHARRELALRCADLPVPSMYVPMADTRLPPEDRADPTAAAAALSELRTASRPEALVDAWLEAYRLDALPQHRIFPDQRRLLPAEAEALIRVVVDWRECARLDACGPDSLFTLRTCALHGCTPGSDLRAAYHQALSPRDYESALAIHDWLQHWQGGGR